MKIALKNGRTLKSISRWISIRTNYNVSPKNSLWDYVTDNFGRCPQNPDFDAESAELRYFRHAGRTYALDQFLRRFSFCGFDIYCAVYPYFITGYDAENYFSPLYSELDASGERIRLWTEI